MSASKNLAVSDFSSESYPNYEARLEDAYIDGYDPVSLGAPHSSLNRTSTWVGMGGVVASLPGLGIFLLGLGRMIVGPGTTTNDPVNLMILGAVIFIVGMVVSFGLIRHGRRYYREYKERTGRTN